MDFFGFLRPSGRPGCEATARLQSPSPELDKSVAARPALPSRPPARPPPNLRFYAILPEISKNHGRKLRRLALNAFKTHHKMTTFSGKCSKHVVKWHVEIKNLNNSRLKSWMKSANANASHLKSSALVPSRAILEVRRRSAGAAQPGQYVRPARPDWPGLRVLGQSGPNGRSWWDDSACLAHWA